MPRENHMHQPPNNGPPSDSLRGGLHGGDLLRAYPPWDPTLNPLVGPYGWPISNPRMFVPPWYPIVIT
jgi:hypothetical protein